ncbi:MAG: hypothetical protein P0Y59_01410 [Candidatus Sphingomonas phytovorans]|nr:hypothetical protein [Sphingomonas sp.]WEK00383.1 MAG: hypothetical protein P0Y59_01410 [Sphingomonas sp.]
MPAAQEFPVDLPGPVSQEHELRWTTIVIAVATVSLTLTNAASIESWSAELTPGPRVAQLLDRAGNWRATTDRAGLGSPRATMHRIWKRLEQASWPGDPAGAQARG